jgi:3-dehydroquinate dehydratase-1
MIRLGAVALSGIPRVVVGFDDRITSHDIDDAQAGGLDIAEIRVDQFRHYGHDYVLKKLDLFVGKIPTIATIRTKDEGGSWSGAEDARRALFEAMIPHVDAVDIELQSAEMLRIVGPQVKRAGKLLVVSFHDFSVTPELSELESIVHRAKAQDADIVKIATNVRDDADVRRLSSLLGSHADKDLVVIGMGGAGVKTRILFPALGSLMTFASALGHHTAPGQLPYVEMFEILRKLYPEYNEEKLEKLKLLECV